MKIYLDTCCLQRPLDTMLQPRIRLESEAVLSLIGLCESGEMELLSSEPLLYEIRRNPNATRRDQALDILRIAKERVMVDDEVESRAGRLCESGLGVIDSLHLAVAEKAKAEYLCTCDDGFIAKANRIEDIGTRVVNPLDILREIG